jgi:hypothetical protein
MQEPATKIRATPDAYARSRGERVTKLCSHIPEAIRLKETALAAEERRLVNFVDFIVSQVPPVEWIETTWHGRHSMPWRCSTLYAKRAI